MNTVAEWSREFDLEYDNITSGRAPGLEPHEKSMFLTQAQENVVIALYKGQLGDSFESTEELTNYLGSLIHQCEGTLVGSGDNYIPISSKSKIYKINNSDVLFVTMEKCTILSAIGDETMVIDGITRRVKTVDVVPMTQDEYWRTTRDPFKKSNSRRVLRLSFTRTSEGVAPAFTEDRYSELISDDPIVKYTVRYIKKPEPIILETLPTGITINGSTTVKTCMLPTAIHRTILAEAVRLAKAVWNS